VVSDTQSCSLAYCIVVLVVLENLLFFYKKSAKIHKFVYLLCMGIVTYSNFWLNMDSGLKKRLKKEIEVYLLKNPAADAKQVKSFIMLGDNPIDISNVKQNTIMYFIRYNIEKFNQSGNLLHRRGNGRKMTPNVIKSRIVSLAKNKGTPGIRGVGLKTGVSFKTVSNVLKEAKLKPYHKYRVQNISDSHQAKRVRFSKYLLRRFGKKVTPESKWAKLINTDFSAKIKINGVRNSKNDVVWSGSRMEAGDLLESPEEKYSVGEMIWGGVSYRGLIPASAPVFVSDLCNKYSPKPTTVNGSMYADLVKEEAKAAVDHLYPEKDSIWQDDGASIHRCEEALEAVQESFHERVCPIMQAPKCADLWPVENLWSIIKAEVAKESVTNQEELKMAITKIWRQVNNNKDLCKQLILSLPRRCQAVINKDGRQIVSADYKS
jgi:hypothetical protein